MESAGGGAAFAVAALVNPLHVGCKLILRRSTGGTFNRL
jgi:hypothetical protein